MLSNVAYAIWKIILNSLKYVQCLNITPMEKTWLMVQMEYSPNGKGIWPQGNIVSWFIAPMEKAWFYKRLFFDVVIVMVKEKKTV